MLYMHIYTYIHYYILKVNIWLLISLQMLKLLCSRYYPTLLWHTYGDEVEHPYMALVMH